MPKVSVILPTYNRAHLLPRAINSVLSQSFKDLELIIIDDCSQDNTDQIVKSADDGRIKHLKHTRNKGSAAAKNMGLKHASGQYIAFLDDDDEWLPGKLQKQVEIIERLPDRVGIVYSNIQKILNNEKIPITTPRFMPEDGIAHKEILEGTKCNIHIQTALIKKECFEKAGKFDEALPRAVDYDLFIRLSKHYLFYHIDECSAVRYAGPGNISSNKEFKVTSRILMLQKYYEDIKALGARALSDKLYNIGIAAYRCRNNPLAREYLVKSIKAFPFRMNAYFTLLRVLLS